MNISLHRSFYQQVILIVLLLLIQSCAYLRDVESPIAWHHYKLSKDKTNKVLIFLPGIKSSMYSFEGAGFFKDIEQYHPEFDVIVVDAHLGYYLQGVMVDELHQNIFKIVKDMGYNKIVLGGISLGGYGTLWYNFEHANEITGMLLFAPYLGDQELIDTIKSNGGVARWRIIDKPDDEDFAKKVWHWIDEGIAEKRSNTLLVYGEDDKFVEAERLLASYLPDSQVIEGAGSHNWVAWRALWLELLSSRKIERLFN